MQKYEDLNTQDLIEEVENFLSKYNMPIVNFAKELEFSYGHIYGVLRGKLKPSKQLIRRMKMYISGEEIKNGHRKD